MDSLGGYSFCKRLNRDKSRNKWWPSVVDASACNDHFMKIIGDYNEIILTKLEVAQDVIFNTMVEAEEYLKWYEGIVYRANNRHRFKIKTTLYLGKKKDEKAESYTRCYTRNSKVTGMPCCHIEFALESSRAIKRALGIRHQSELPTAMEAFFMLENNLLRYQGIRELRGTRFGSQYIPGVEYRRIRDRLAGVRGWDRGGNSLSLQCVRGIRA